jgi:hypothetical protein
VTGGIDIYTDHPKGSWHEEQIFALAVAASIQEGGKLSCALPKSLAQQSAARPLSLSPGHQISPLTLNFVLITQFLQEE